MFYSQSTAFPQQADARRLLVCSLRAESRTPFLPFDSGSGIAGLSWGVNSWSEGGGGGEGAGGESEKRQSL